MYICRYQCQSCRLIESSEAKIESFGVHQRDESASNPRDTAIEQVIVRGGQDGEANVYDRICSDESPSDIRRLIVPVAHVVDRPAQEEWLGIFEPDQQ